jgi:hypothetical protein
MDKTGLSINNLKEMLLKEEKQSREAAKLANVEDE